MNVICIFGRSNGQRQLMAVIEKPTSMPEEAVYLAYCQFMALDNPIDREWIEACLIPYATIQRGLAPCEQPEYLADAAGSTTPDTRPRGQRSGIDYTSPPLLPYVKDREP